MAKHKEIKIISPKSFSKYGDILLMPDSRRESDVGERVFEVITSEKRKTGWRLASYVVRARGVKQLEQHPGSRESFEPVWGVALIALAPPEHPEEHEIFLLDKPVCLRPGVWHGVMALSEEAEMKIAENSEVESNFYDLKEELRPAIVC
ncbi:MAG: hypothetical protein ACUVXI_10910 [bacterium]